MLLPGRDGDFLWQWVLLLPVEPGAAWQRVPMCGGMKHCVYLGDVCGRRRSGVHETRMVVWNGYAVFICFRRLM